jgi:hypothetical protein
MAYQNGRWINDGLATQEGLRGWARRHFFNEDNGKKKGPNRLVTGIFVILGLIVVITGFFYMSRLKNVPGSGTSAEGSSSQLPYGQINADLAVPTNISVTADKGATIKWQAENDSRILGYNVYRYTGEDNAPSRINSSIVADTVYFDDEGTMFNSYAVAAVDNDGKQSELSRRVEASAEPNSMASLTPTQQPQQIQDFTFEDNGPHGDLPAGMVACNGKGMTYTGVWYLEHYAEVTGGVVMVTPYYGNACTYTFTASSVTVIATRHWNYGIMSVYIDGQMRQEVDLYSAQIVPNDRVFTASGLGEGVHTIRLECTGRKNPQANFTFINIVGLEIK